jgi:membrane protein DedA with SNARE-associated domain
MSHLLDQVLGLHGLAVYLIVGGLVFAEDALFLGFVIPGETAAILGGVAASRGNASLILICIVVVLAAIIGDSVGYEIGARYGQRLLGLPILSRRKARIDAARDTLARRGGPAVFGGRFVAFLRAVMPFLAGTSHMRYRRFLACNAAGGIIWGTAAVLLGFLAGNSYAAIEKTFGRVVAVAAAVLVVAGLIIWRIRRQRHERATDLAADTTAREHGDEHDA